MNIIRSPWLAQLKPKDEPHVVFENRTSDVSIIGAGIAGITTAYFLLKNTDKKIIIVESGRVAHGATGHNAGQIVSYFERQISDLVQEFGLELTAQAQNAIDSAWNLLENIYQDANLETPYSVFTGYAGCQDLEETLVHLENNMYASLAKINMEPLMIAKDLDVAKQIPEKYKGLYSLCPHEDILSLLETEDTNYIAAISARKGVMNSALFCEELLDYLYITYPDRFTLFEGSHVDEVVLQPDDAILRVKGYEIRSGCVVLCTNGFEKFKITNTVGADIDTKFHHLVQGSVGYMAGYLEEHTKSPIAISYLPKKSHTGNSQFDADPYFYLTRRTFEVEPNKTHSLICVGGPEARMDDTNDYSREHPYPDEAQGVIDEFLRKTYVHAPKGEIDYVYKWHGLMGYTPNGVRLIGPEPINPILMYNLGCNGVGILPSIYGAHKIAQFVNKEELGPSIFDVKDQRNL
jgi:glycine/D-amino acid oxidase-like deaminating enzyme